MPYSVGEKGSYGCSGYPVLKDDDKTVMGCHDTAQEAGAQIAAIEANENKTYEEKDTVTNDGGMGIKNPDEWPVSKANPCWEGYTMRGMKPGENGRMVPNCVPVSNKSDSEINEGDYVMGRTSEGIAHGRVEHIMWEGGTLGTPGTEYALQSMPPENPAMSVRVYEEDGDGWEATAYSIGMMYLDAQKLPSLEGHSMPSDMDDDLLELMSKAETFTPNAGMKAAARRALKWKEDGKATGAGTPVGWGRARDIVAGRPMSLSTVRRMFSFFSRHEASSKGGKDFNNTSNPSNGRIMWDAWGGNAGFAWSRAIVNRMKDKALFADFGKDYTRSTRLSKPFL